MASGCRLSYNLDSIPLVVDLPLQGSQAQHASSDAYGKVMRIPAM